MANTFFKLNLKPMCQLKDAGFGVLVKENRATCLEIDSWLVCPRAKDKQWIHPPHLNLFFFFFY